MARRSRKNTSYTVNDSSLNELTAKKYRAALYCRISVETLETVARDTMGTQLLLLKEFAATIPDLTVIDVYTDNDVTGTNFNRPEYERMMQDVDNGRINCIIVKDLSRFAREHIGAGEYLEKIFPEKGVRFIAVTDNIDTLVDDGGIIVPFKNVINERYAKDASAKVAGNFKVMQKKGLFCGSKPPFGYVPSKEDKHVFVIDPEAAQVVKKIYEWYLSGMSMHQISKLLEAENVLSPYKYGVEKGHFKENYPKKSHQAWSGALVRKILDRRQYCGDMVQNMVESTFLETGIKGSYRYNDKENWIIVENTHEAIVTREDYAKVQERLLANVEKKRMQLEMNKQIKNPEYCLSGVLKCAHCGSGINVKRSVKKGVAKYSYVCPRHDSFGSAGCEKKNMNFEEMNQLVFELLKKHIHNFFDLEQALRDTKDLHENLSKSAQIKLRIRKLDTELQRTIILKTKLYEEFCTGIIVEDEYLSMMEKYSVSIKEYETTIEKLVEGLTDCKEKEEIGNSIEKVYRQYLKKRKLSRAMVETFIENIVVHNDGTMDVSFKVKDEYEDMLHKLLLRKEEECNAV